MNANQLRTDLLRLARQAPQPSPDLADRVLRQRRQNQVRAARLLGVAVATVFVLIGGTLIIAVIDRAPVEVSAGPNASPDASAEADALRLIGLWSVQASGIDPGTVLRLDSAELVVFGECVLLGQWQTNVRGDFVAATNAFSGSCPTQVTTPSWLATARAFRIEGADAVLIDDTGTPTARLRPGAVPEVPPNLSASYADPPEVTDVDRQWLRAEPDLPGELTPATAEQLVGRWLPIDASNPDAFANFTVTGAWTGSDGCNDIGGRWFVGLDGALEATSGPETLRGCYNVDISGWLLTAVAAGFDGEVLVLVGNSGQEISRLTAG